jgi:acyl dehydratase
MTIDRRHLGHSSGPYLVEVESGQLKFFAKATDERNPIYFDEEAAREADHPALPAPPTFVFSLAFHSPVRLEDFGIDIRYILHGEQAFRNYAQIYAGDRMTLTTEVVDIYEKKNGALEFLVQRTRATNQHGILCTEMDVTTIVRHD